MIKSIPPPKNVPKGYDACIVKKGYGVRPNNLLAVTVTFTYDTLLPAKAGSRYSGKRNPNLLIRFYNRSSLIMNSGSRIGP